MDAELKSVIVELIKEIAALVRAARLEIEKQK